MTNDYSLFSRREFLQENLQSLEYDLFVSAFNESERVRSVFEGVRADQRHWLLQPEYRYQESEWPVADTVYAPLAPVSEAEFWLDYFDQTHIDSQYRGARVGIDITGMMRPHLVLLPRLLRAAGWDQVDFLYSDPVAYASGDKTQFAQGAIERVAQVEGFEGDHTADAGDNDLLVIGAGYDDELIRRVAESKPAARKIQLFGLPSLQPHMYQESHLRAQGADESVGPGGHASTIFAPANNPFMTAQVLHDRVNRERDVRGLSNLYLSPLGTKPQVLGFAWYYLLECVDTASSVIFPYAPYYTRETTTGLSRTSVYRMELQWAW